jgi:hypothetical protein
LIDLLLIDDPMSHFIIGHCIVRIVPMISVDGVVEGSYRISSVIGCALNRMWEKSDGAQRRRLHRRAPRDGGRAVAHHRDFLRAVHGKLS